MNILGEFNIGSEWIRNGFEINPEINSEISPYINPEINPETNSEISTKINSEINSAAKKQPQWSHKFQMTYLLH